MKKIVLFLVLGMLCMSVVSAAQISLADYSSGEDVGGVVLGDFLTITSPDSIVTVTKQDQYPLSFTSNRRNQRSAIINGCVPRDGAISDGNIYSTSDYQFDFASSVSTFSVVMYDFGDWNPLHKTVHHVELQAYDADDVLVDVSVLEFTSTAQEYPQSYDLAYGGDACLSANDYSEPGKWKFAVSGDDIAYARLVVDGGDPAYAIGSFEYTPVGETCTNNGKKCNGKH